MKGKMNGGEGEDGFTLTHSCCSYNDISKPVAAYAAFKLTEEGKMDFFSKRSPPPRGRNTRIDT